MEKDEFKLSNIKKVNEPFTLNQNYFEENAKKLAEEIQNKIDGKFTLSSIPKKFINDIPDNYFKDFEKSIIQKSENTEAEEENRNHFLPRKRTLFSAAAGIAIIGVLMWLSLPKKQYSIENEVFDSFSSSEMQSFLINQDVSTEDLLDKDITKTDSDSLIVNNLEFSQREIINYLEDQRIEDL